MARPDSGTAELLEELQRIRKLLIFALLKSGASQSDIASALGMDQSSVSRMLSKATGGSTGKAKKKKLK